MRRSVDDLRTTTGLTIVGDKFTHAYQTHSRDGGDFRLLLGQGVDAALVTPDHILRLAEPTMPWTKDWRGSMPRNLNCPGKLSNGWWKREIASIDALVFHHTKSHAPEALALWYIYDKPWKNAEGKMVCGRPSSPYTLWVTQTGDIILCNDLSEGCWHNHNGHQNRELSVGLAGDLTKHKPPVAQLDAAAKLAAWAIRWKGLPYITGLEQIKGHDDYIETACPGWNDPNTGRWKTQFMAMISRF